MECNLTPALESVLACLDLLISMVATADTTTCNNGKIALRELVHLLENLGR